jgi:small subunit ribosomal protein S6
MKHYELLFVVKPTLTEEEVKAKFDFIKGVMEKNGCEIKAVKDMGVRKLAYEIEKYERGHYFVLYYTAAPSSLEEILRNLRLTEEIIRFLNMKFEKKKEIAQWEKMVKATTDKKEAKPVKTEAPKEEAPKEEPKAEEPKTEEVKVEVAKEETPAPVEEAKTEETPAKDAE